MIKPPFTNPIATKHILVWPSWWRTRHYSESTLFLLLHQAMCWWLPPQVNGNTCYWSWGFQMQELSDAVGIVAAVGPTSELPMISPKHSEWHSMHPKDHPLSNYRLSAWVQHQSILWQNPFTTHKTLTGRLRQTSNTSQGHQPHLVQNSMTLFAIMCTRS